MLAFPNSGMPKPFFLIHEEENQFELELKLIRQKGFDHESEPALKNMEQPLKESHVKQLVSMVAPDQNLRFSLSVAQCI